MVIPRHIVSYLGRCADEALESGSAPSVQLLLLFRMDDMAVDSDEEVDYSKMDQVWSLKQLLFSTYPFPHSQNMCLINWSSLLSYSHRSSSIVGSWTA